MKHIQFSISVDEEYQEPLIAELEQIGFEGYQQLDEELVAYISQSDLQIGDREHIEQLLAVYPGNNFIQTEEIVNQQNWNREWEKTIDTVVVGDFLIKPTWSTEPVKANQILLEIDPKMAFGTGYHATTRLMLKMLSQIDLTDKSILDAGTGTGILAIAAVKRGAKSVIAFDIDEWSIKNTQENILINKVDNKIDVREGSIEVVKEKFDIILANINKNTIISFLNSFSKQMNSSGILLLSGFLNDDEQEIKDHLKRNNLKLVKTVEEEEWLSVVAKKGIE